LKEENPNAALESFQRVLDLEKGDKGEWGFKALKQVAKSISNDILLFIPKQCGIMP